MCSLLSKPPPSAFVTAKGSSRQKDMATVLKLVYLFLLQVSCYASSQIPYQIDCLKYTYFLKSIFLSLSEQFSQNPFSLSVCQVNHHSVALQIYPFKFVMTQSHPACQSSATCTDHGESKLQLYCSFLWISQPTWTAMLWMFEWWTTSLLQWSNAWWKLCYDTTAHMSNEIPFSATAVRCASRDCIRHRVSLLQSRQWRQYWCIWSWTRNVFRTTKPFHSD